MASNFGITVDKINDGFGLVLEGDFDATSAYELVYAIKKLPEDTLKFYIYTNGLKNITPSGLDVLHRYMRCLNGQTAKHVFTGNSASQLCLGNFRLACSANHFSCKPCDRRRFAICQNTPKT